MNSSAILPDQSNPLAAEAAHKEDTAIFSDLTLTSELGTLR